MLFIELYRLMHVKTHTYTRIGYNVRNSVYNVTLFTMEKKIENLVRHADVSEKAIERYLCDVVKKLGGICLKYSNPNMVGYPDRVALLPDGRTIWIELKSKGQKPEKRQAVRFAEMERIGHTVYVADSKESINGIFQDLNYEI